ncbi:DUF1643 domain-containing protein [Prochlorococcus sp. AH-716-A09]|nr:DUF1643 domain-containing protein [Prochlorococcus sp. AH-716-A09]
MERSCLISTNKEYRWSLSFKINKAKKEIIFIGLNPSLSDLNYIDNTTRKIIKICKNHNYGNIKIINLFALISKTPDKLFAHKKPVGYLNNKFINKSLKYWSENKDCHLWLGWGNKGIFLNRNYKISKKIMNFYSIKKDNYVNPLGPLFIKKTKKQNPIHPLYCSNNSVLQSESSLNFS